MNESKSFFCHPSRFHELIQSTQNWLTSEGFECQRLKTEDGGTLIQIVKSGRWRKLVGMSTALNIIFRESQDKVDVEIGAGRWIDKASVGALSLVILWPLAITAGIGAWKQVKMPERIYSYISEWIG